jgi:hypothetical protein
MEELGIADTMAKKVIFKPALDGGVQLVVAGSSGNRHLPGERSRWR